MARSSRGMEVELKAQGRHEVEKLLATVALGLATAVESGAMAPSDACGYFFVPVFLSVSHPPSRSRGRVDPDLIKALHAGSELEDVERLAPRGLKRALRDVRVHALRVLGKLPPSEAPLAAQWLSAPVGRGPLRQRRRTPRASSGAARGDHPRR